MRLWHKDLICVLPQKQLVAQWRELCCIAKNLATNGTPNHLLVNKILEYQVKHFIMYCNAVTMEMWKRGINVREDAYLRLCENIKEAEDKGTFGIMFCNNLYEYWHDERYLKQCLFNLQEKYDCGGIPEKEWKVIEGRFGKLL